MRRRSGLVVRRALGHRLLIVAAATTALFAVTVLAALGGYSASVTDKELRTTLAGASFNSAGTRISTTVTARDIPAAQRKIAATVADVYEHIPTAMSLSARGDSYVVPGQERSTHPELTAFATYSGIENHAKLTAGRWPADTTSGAIEVALPVPAARAMRLAVGRTVTLHSRVEGPTVTVKVTGLFAVDRPDDYFWGGDRLITTGSERLGYTTFGPLVVPNATFSARFTTSVTARWLVFPSVREIRAGQLTHVAERARALRTILGKGPAGDGYAVMSSAPDLLIRVDRALLVARSTLLIPALQLVVLAVYTLILVARLMTEHRRVEISLMRARGAAGRQIAGLAISEGLLICVPAAVAAPFLAPPLVRAVTMAPMLKASGTRLDLAPSVLMWGIAIAAALACAIAITLPPLRGIRQTYVGTLAERGRGELRGAIQRAGGDVVLVVLAALAIWQLSHYGGPVTGTTSNGLGIDPLIVAGPALALLAGGVVLLRLVPLVSRVAERITAHSRGVAAAVGTRQVSRRPLRAAGPTLLLVMTVAVGVLSVATGATWRQSQVDQADFQAGTDLRITAPNDPSAPAPASQGGVYARLPGVTAVSPVLRNNGSTGSTDVTVLGVDATKLGGMLRTHAGLPADTPIDRLAAGRANSAQIPVPGRPARLAADIRIDATGGKTPVDVSMIISDALHVIYEVRLAPTPADGKSHTRVIDLAGLAGKDGVISYPFAVQGFRFGYVRSAAAAPTRLTVSAVRPTGDGGSGHALTTPAESHWAGQFTMSAGLSDAFRFRRGGSIGLLTVGLPNLDDPFISTPEISGIVIFRHGADAETEPDLPQPAPIPAIVTTVLASRAHLRIGSRLTVDVNGVEQPITVAGIVPALPSTSVDTPGVLVDWAALGGEALMAGTTPNNPTEWWLAARGGDTKPAARALSTHPAWSAGTVDRIALRHQLRDAPLGGALQGALVLGFAAALVFAAIGFAVNTAVSARERVGEFAILRALGVSGRQVLGLVAVEQAFLVGLGLAGGVLLGILIAHLVVPHVVLTARATTPYPPAHVILQWPVILAMLGGVAVLLVAILLLLVRSLRRRGLAHAVGLGED